MCFQFEVSTLVSNVEHFLICVIVICIQYLMKLQLNNFTYSANVVSYWSAYIFYAIYKQKTMSVFFRYLFQFCNFSYVCDHLCKRGYNFMEVNSLIFYSIVHFFVLHLRNFGPLNDHRLTLLFSSRFL